MSTQYGYGFFPGGDPRKFTPDEECNSAEELTAWRDACDAWDLGIQVDRGSECIMFRDDGQVAIISVVPLGIGMYEYEDDGEPDDEEETR